MSYLSWNEQTISDFSDETINTAYNNGYVFTRVKKGFMNHNESLRIDLSKFELSSENRRILRKTEEILFSARDIPYKYYHWGIAKMGKNFYDTKFGENTFSANKIKELLTNNHNFNKLFSYSVKGNQLPNNAKEPDYHIGFCIVVETNELIHYCYPFYDLTTDISNLGMGMMLKAILYAEEQGKKYIYLGSFQRPGDVYKLQFEGLEWFGGEGWSNNLDELKRIL